MKRYIGIDNGVSGACACITAEGEALSFIPTPIFKQDNYTKPVKKKGKPKLVQAQISRLNYKAFSRWLKDCIDWPSGLTPFIMLERPLVNPGRFKASISAVRCLEAQLVAIEDLNMPCIYQDSKAWQKALLPPGISGDALKTASLEVGIKLFPQYEKEIRKQKDADALLIAEYARRMQL